TSFSRNCSSNVDMRGNPVALVSVIPGVVITNDVVTRKVPLASAAPAADATGIIEPMISNAAVVSSILPTILASPLTPKTPSQLMNGLCWINGAIASAAYGVNFWIPNQIKIATMDHLSNAR